MTACSSSSSKRKFAFSLLARTSKVSGKAKSPRAPRRALPESIRHSFAERFFVVTGWCYGSQSEVAHDRAVRDVAAVRRNARSDVYLEGSARQSSEGVAAEPSVR